MKKIADQLNSYINKICIGANGRLFVIKNVFIRPPQYTTEIRKTLLRGAKTEQVLVKPEALVIEFKVGETLRTNIMLHSEHTDLADATNQLNSISISAINYLLMVSDLERIGYELKNTNI